MNIRLRRRLDMLDYEVESRIRRTYTPDNICRFRSGEELLDVVSDDAIDSMYFNYFAYMDDDGKLWNEMYNDMVRYISDTYGDKIKEYYHINCGS